MPRRVSTGWRVANPRGVSDGTRILALAPVHEACAGAGCADCEGGGRLVEREWYEGDAIAEGDVSAVAWARYVEGGFIVPFGAAQDGEAARG